MFFYVTLMILTGFIKAASEPFKVIGPAAPLFVDQGEDLVLPCSLRPNISAVDMRVEWSKLGESTLMVHLYKDHAERPDEQAENYRGRTCLFKEELKNGNTSLKLSGVQPSDEGHYNCLIESNSEYDDVNVEVKVKAAEGFKVVGPPASLFVKSGEDVVLPCSLKPKLNAENMRVEWLKLGERTLTVHLYKDSTDRNDEQANDYRGRTSLFKEKLKTGNTSMKLSAVQPSDEGVYKCLIESSSGYDDVNIHIKVKDVFHSWKIALICVLVFSFGLIVFAAFIWKGSPLHPYIHTRVQCSAIAYMRLHSENVRKEWDLNKYYTSEAGCRRLIPAITNCTKAQLTGCIFTEKSIITLKETLEAETSSLKELDLSYNDLQNSRLKELAEGLKRLETLRFMSCKLSDASFDTVQSVLQSENTCLKNLDLSNNDLKDSGVEKLCAGLRSPLCKLETLRLAGCILTEKSIITLSESLQAGNSPLKELDLSYNNLQGSRFEELSKGLKRLKTLRLMKCKLSNESLDIVQSVLKSENYHLKNLDLSNNDLQDSRGEKLCVGLKNEHCTLKTLRLADCNLTEEVIKTLNEALQSENSSLKELDLSKNDLQSSRLKQLCVGLWSLEILRLTMCKLSKESCDTLKLVLKSENSSLKNLDLSYNYLQDSGLERLCDGLRSPHCKLETLGLSECCLGEQTCEQLSPILQLENFSLKDLNLSNNDLQDSGVEKLCVGLKSSHCKLETLRLSGCMITKKGCASLASALSSNPSYLKELDLSYNHPGNIGVKLLSDKKEDSGCRLHTLGMDHAGVIRVKPGLRKYACELTLDPNTVNTHLSLSEGNRKADNVEQEQLYPDHPERFDWPQVLCRQSLTGRCYWETEWSGEGVYISVAYKSIRRKGRSGDCEFGANEKSWSLVCSDKTYIVFHNKNIIDLPPPPSSSNRVGVYVDYNAGTLSFYSVSTDTHTLTHLHTFTTTFNELLCAGFWVDYYSSMRLCQIKYTQTLQLDTAV